MPSRCIFFFSAFSAWSILLSRTMICKGGSWPVSERGRGDTRRPLALSTPECDVGQSLAPLTGWLAALHIQAMAILKIARMGHPVLAPGAPNPSPTRRRPEIRRLVDDMVETMIDANGAGPGRAPGPCAAAGGGFPGPGRAHRPRPVRRGAVRPHRPPDRPDQPARSRFWSRDSKAAGKAACRCRACAAGRAAGPYPLSRLRPGRKASSSAPRAAFTPASCSMKWIIWTAMLYPQRMTDLSKLIFESEARHWAEARI